MNTDLFQLAKKLAMRPYLVMTAKSETTDGQSIFNARTLEIENCFGQGETPEQAIQDLREALVDYIEGLLEDGLPVLEPFKLKRTIKTTASVIVTLSSQGKRASQKSEIYRDSYILSAHAS